MSFSYDGNEILVVADYDDTTRVQRLNIAARTVTAVNGAYCEDGDYIVKSSPDQPKFVYYIKDGGVAVMNDFSAGVADTLDTLGVQPDW